MGEITLRGEPNVTVTLRRSRRARRMSLRVSRLDGRVTMTLPRGTPLADARAFAEEKAGWIRRHLADLPAAERVGFGTVLPVEGRATLVAPGRRTRLMPAEGRLEVAAEGEAVAAAVAARLKLLARARLADSSDRHSAALGRGYARLTLRDTRSRWGSCSAAGGLMYSWRLVMAPPEVLDYVAAHEVAHLEEMNHSARFWAVVARLCPDYAAPRRWLREEGERLHRYRFRD